MGDVPSEDSYLTLHEAFRLISLGHNTDSAIIELTRDYPNVSIDATISAFIYGASIAKTSLSTFNRVLCVLFNSVGINPENLEYDFLVRSQAQNDILLLIVLYHHLFKLTGSKIYFDNLQLTVQQLSFSNCHKLSSLGLVISAPSSPFSAQSFVACSLFKTAVTFQNEDLLKWIGENFVTCVTTSGSSDALLYSLRQWARRDDESTKAVFTPLNRLLLRNPVVILKCLLKFDLSLHQLDLYFGDTFWSQVFSEKDDHRAAALKVLSVSVLSLADAALIEKLVLLSATKTPKAKCSLLEQLHSQLNPSSHKSLQSTLDNLISKENSEEAIYWLLLCKGRLEALNLVGHILKPSKPNWRTPYLAAACSSSHQSPPELIPLFGEKSLSKQDCLLLLLSFSSSKENCAMIPEKWMQAQLSTLDLKQIKDILMKFPLLPLENFLMLFSFPENVITLKDRKLLWSILFSLFCDFPRVRTKMASFIQNNSISINLSTCIDTLLDALNGTSHKRSIIMRFIKCVIVSKNSLVDMLPVLRHSEIGQDDLKFVSHLDTLLASDEAMKKLTSFLLASKNTAFNQIIVASFPELFNTLIDSASELVAKIVKMTPNEETFAIISAKEEDLPVIDVIEKLRKANEQAGKKDSKKLLSGALLVKAENSAIETELARERDIRSTYAGINQQLTTISQLLTIHLKATYELHSLDCSLAVKTLKLLLDPASRWAYSAMANLAYALSYCCKFHPSFPGPLFVSLFLSLQPSTIAYIDRNWNVTVSLMGSKLTTVFSHPESVNSLSFAYAFSFITSLYSLSTVAEYDQEMIKASVYFLKCNLSNLELSGEELPILLQSFVNLVSYLPAFIPDLLGVLQAQSKAVDDGNKSACILQLKSSNKFIRKFVLEYLVSICQEKPVFLEDKESLLWLCVFFGDVELSSISKRVINCVDSGLLVELLKISLDEEIAEDISLASMKSILSLKEDTEAVLNLLEVKYKQLFKERIPETTRARFEGVDLTVVARQRLAMLYSIICENWTISNNLAFSLLRLALSDIFFDPNDKVHTSMLNAIGQMVSKKLDDTEAVSVFAAILDEFLATNRGSDDVNDRVRVYAVILLAKVAEKFESSDKRRIEMLNSLYSTLAVPSESVQYAVADAMVGLFNSINLESTSEWVSKFLNQAFNGSNMASRRGAAYGLAALVKAKGSSTLKKCVILESIIQILSDKSSSWESRQGALFCLELISKYLRNLFEPYVLSLLELLIATFADGKSEIREATIDAAQTMMSSVSSLGARILLPILLKLLESTNWRSKVGAIEWLAAMASLSPKVLARQLPIILPRLTIALTESHHNVQKAARDALMRYCSVVRNPEIKAISGTILEALANPPQYTEKCLHTILHTAFAHVIDCSSIAMIEPILRRGLFDRFTGGTEIKKMSAQIIGNLATNLVDPRDMAEFLPSLVPELLKCLSDPVPEVRSHCGKVLGVLVKAVGERHASMANLETQLLNIVVSSEASSVDRAGAAQAMAEILAARGPQEACKLLDSSIMDGLNSGKGFIKQGLLMLVGYIPAAFDMHQNLDEIYETSLRPLLSMSMRLLADHNEAVREAANETCHNIISRCAGIDHVAIFDVLLQSLSEINWRCRLGCLKLFHEFLSKFSEHNTEEDTESSDSLKMPTSDELLQGGIDEQRVKNLMAKAFLFRFDPSSGQIRHYALAIWKALALHPLRAIASILNELVNESCILLDAAEGEGREIVWKSFDDIMGKIGDRLLLPLLQISSNIISGNDTEEAEDEDGGRVEGVVTILTMTVKIMGSGNFANLSSTLTNEAVLILLQLIQSTLCSSNTDVRRQAGCLFVTLCTSAEQQGFVQVDKIMSELLAPLMDELLTDPVLDPVSMESIIILLKADAVNGRVFDFVIEEINDCWKDGGVPIEEDLLKSRVEVTGGVFAAVGGDAAFKAVPLLRVILSNEQATAHFDGGALDSLIISILTSLEAEEDSPYQISLSQLLEGLFGEESTMAYSFRIVRLYCQIPGADLGRFYAIWPSRLLSSLSSPNELANKEARECLIALLESVKNNGRGEMEIAESFVDALRKKRRFTSADKDVFACLVKTVLVPLLTQSTMLAGELVERRELAANLTILLTENLPSIVWTSSSLTGLVGALIRCASDRATSVLGSKISVIFEALTACVVSQVVLLKPFHPQLQRIYLNALSTIDYRNCAVRALSVLLPALSRPDSLLNELFQQISNEEENKETRMDAMEVLLISKTVSEATASILVNCASAALSSSDAEIREMAARWISAVLDKAELSSHHQQLISLVSSLN